jgi:hypothetical protein
MRYLEVVSRKSMSAICNCNCNRMYVYIYILPTQYYLLPRQRWPIPRIHPYLIRANPCNKLKSIL